ncbi:MAG: glycosyltransferase [Polyangiaceae bacterium]
MIVLAISLALSLSALATALYAWMRVRAAGGATGATSTRDVLLLRPCAGSDAWLERALMSSEVVLRHARSARVRFLIATGDDEARPAAERVARVLASRGADAAVLVTEARGPNRKADQIARALALVSGASDERVIVADADVELDDAVTSALLVASERSALAWAPPIEVSARTFGDRVSGAVLDASLHAFSLLGRLDPRGVVGKCFVAARATLDAVDAASLRHHLGEDMEIGQRLAARGSEARMVTAAARSLVAARALGAVTERYRRWLVVIRAQRPALLASYPVLLASSPLAMAAAVAAREPRALAVAVVARMSVAALARRSAGRAFSLSSLALGFFADAVLLVAWIGAIASPRVRWRGITLVARAGHLEVES